MALIPDPGHFHDHFRPTPHTSLPGKKQAERYTDDFRKFENLLTPIIEKAVTGPENASYAGMGDFSRVKSTLANLCYQANVYSEI